MKKTQKYLWQRALWYLAGFILFYAPFALFQRLLMLLFNFEGRPTIHGICYRMAMPEFLRGSGPDLLTTTGIAIVLFFGLAFLIGPVFCGRFCLTGAFPEYLSRLVPDRFKVNWQKYIDPTPVRYGFLTGFMLVPMIGMSICCSYCNFSVMERLITAGITREMAVMGSTTILTGIFWLLVLGVFSKGGRAFCSYFCPVGAVLSLIHSIGSKLGFTYKLKFIPEKCISCNICIKECPMGAMQTGETSETGLKHNIHDCITCLQCKNSCPTAAIDFGRGKDRWNEKPVREPVKAPELTV